MFVELLLIVKRCWSSTFLLWHFELGKFWGQSGHVMWCRRDEKTNMEPHGTDPKIIRLFVVKKGEPCFDKIQNFHSRHTEDQMMRKNQ
jgi:hypothetical protein